MNINVCESVSHVDVTNRNKNTDIRSCYFLFLRETDEGEFYTNSLCGKCLFLHNLLSCMKSCLQLYGLMPEVSVKKC